jgi:DNA-binding winged helix-turn-helix (wHTH) protein
MQDSNNRDVFTKILTTDISNLRSIIRSPGQTDQYLQTNPLAIDLYPTT